MGFFNSFKKVVGKINPIKGAILGSSEKKGSKKPYLEKGARLAHEKDLEGAMKDYDAIPGMLRTQYLDSARRAGTYADTPEFAAGLNSEVEAGARGARAAAIQRINALHKSLGKDEFNPDGWQATQANATEDNLAKAPIADPTAPTDAAIPRPTVPQADDAPAVDAGPDDTANAAANTQSVKPTLPGNKLQQQLGGLASRLMALKKRT